MNAGDVTTSWWFAPAIILGGFSVGVLTVYIMSIFSARRERRDVSDEPTPVDAWAALTDDDRAWLAEQGWTP